MAATWISEPELADLIGKRESDLLCRTYGGISYHIPATPSPGHAFAPIVGMSAMRILCQSFPGQWIQFPNRRRAEHLKAVIVERLEKGHAQTAIALELGCTERWVQMVASATRDCSQYKLPL